jgi:Ca2+-binding EF-hand superfamily protein
MLEAGNPWGMAQVRIMKCTMLVSLVLLGSFVGIATAQVGKKPDLAKAAEMQKKLLEKFDANKDGVLSDTEKLAAADALKQGGALGGAGLVPGSEEYMKKFDRNGDGKLSDAEKLVALSAWQKIRAGAGGGGPVTGGFGGQNPGSLPAGIDAPAGDGEKPTKKVNPLIKLYDKDGDGKLNEEEKAALQAERNKKKTKKA